MERTPTSDEVLRRVGRNLVIFQKIEYALKLLLVQHKMTGPIDKLVENHLARAASMHKTMLGHLVEKYVTDVLSDAGENVPEEEMLVEGEIAFSFRVSAETELIEQLRSDLKAMTDERNELVHHFLPRWQPDNDVVLMDALGYLDAQREKVLPILLHLRSVALSQIEATRVISEFFSEPEDGQRIELLWLQASPLVTFLGDIASQYHRKDGWAYLAQAGHFAAKKLPDEIKSLRERYGFKTLKQLMLGVGAFDIFDEPLVGGGFRTLYKRKGNQ